MSLFDELNKQSFEDMKIIDEYHKRFLNVLKREQKNAQYSKDIVMQMRLNNDNRLYKNPSDVITSHGCVWENGKVGYFIPFDHGGITDLLLCGGRRNDGKGLRFVHTHENCVMLAHSQNNGIVVSGFGEYVLQNWGKNLLELCEEYTVGKAKKRIAQWKKENYPNAIDQQMAFHLLSEFKETEQNRWEKATIADFLTSEDNEKIKQCMEYYFQWLDGYISGLTENSQKQKADNNDNENAVFVFNKEQESKIIENYNFWINLEQKDKRFGYVNIFNDFTQQRFFEMIYNADFSELYNKPSIKQRVGYNVGLLSKIINNDEWTKKAEEKLNSKKRDLMKNTNFPEHKALKKAFQLYFRREITVAT